MPTTGIQALLQMLANAGVKYIFGNPGTTVGSPGTELEFAL